MICLRGFFERTENMLFYIDYLDHETRGSRSFNMLIERLRYDLLIFSSDTLCMSVPACIKLRDTTSLLIQLDEFWKNKKIQLQLDVKKHDGKATNYFKNRKAVLEKNVHEEKLSSHFEYAAYTDKRTENFFNIYLPQMVSAAPEDIFINKKNDTDVLFRNNAIELFERYYDSFCRSIQPNDQIIFTGIVRKVEALATDENSLFQRSVVEDYISEEFNPSADKMNFVTTLLDRAFALANADTNEAKPLSFVLNQLTGGWLVKLLKKTYGNLHNLICELSWDEVYELSQDKDWRAFVGYVNAFIWIVQDSTLKSSETAIASSINKLSRYISLLSFWKTVKEEAVEAVKQKMYEFGLVSEAQNFEIMLELSADCYAGKHKVLLDVVNATDMIANRLFEKLDKEKKLSYLLEYEQKQKQKGYEIFR